MIASKFLTGRNAQATHHIESWEAGIEDGQTANFWHTEWKNAQPNYPHRLILNLGQSQVVSGFRFVPRQGEGGGRIKDYQIYVGDALVF